MTTDDYCLDIIGGNPDMLVPWILMASYLYYHRDTQLLTDAVFDILCTTLQGQYDCVNHIHKYLITRSDLQVVSLFKLEEGQYPRSCVGAALSVRRDLC